MSKEEKDKIVHVRLTDRELKLVAEIIDNDPEKTTSSIIRTALRYLYMIKQGMKNESKK